MCLYINILRKINSNVEPHIEFRPRPLSPYITIWYKSRLLVSTATRSNKIIYILLTQGQGLCYVSEMVWY